MRSRKQTAEWLRHLGSTPVSVFPELETSVAREDNLQVRCDADMVKLLLSSLPFIFYAGLDTPGTGLDVIVPVETDDWRRHGEYFYAVKEAIELLGLKVSSIGASVCSTISASYDAEAYRNNSCQVFRLPKGEGAATPNPMEKEEKLEIIRDLYSDGKSARAIAQELGISHTQVNRLLKEMFLDGTLNKRGNGTVPQVTEVPDVPPVPQVSTDVPPVPQPPKRKRKPKTGT